MTKLGLAATCLIALIVAANVRVAQSTAAPAGHWEGAIQTPGQELKIEIDLAGAGDKWEGTITCSVSDCELTETYSPAAIESAPATNPAAPATRTS